MSINQSSPPQMTAAQKFLIHALWSLLYGAIAAGVIATIQYITITKGPIDIRTAAGIGFGVFCGYLLAHFTMLSNNQTLILQGIEDTIKAVHSPLLDRIDALIHLIETSEAVTAVHPAIARPPAVSPTEITAPQTAQ